MGEKQWDRITELFDRLMGGARISDLLASEPDPEIRKAVENLWCHHLSAGAENFLGGAMEFGVLPMFQPGQVLLNRFEIEKMLGSGGMGEVYLAFDRRIEERVALKTIARLLAPSASIRRRILAEVQNARRVTHPNVCRIHELFDDNETMFFTMEYVAGRVLSEVADQVKALGSARTVVLQMSEGLHAAHRTGVVHGDFKPGNVMIASEGSRRAVVMDFGLARALDRTGSPRENSLSYAAGTVDYMAPELRAGAEPTIRSDIYAFGKVVRELLPRERIWNQCTQAAAGDRPESLEPVINRLRSSKTRRYWIGTGVVAAAGAMRYLTRASREYAAVLPNQARILINGFRAVGEQVPEMRLARSLFLTALYQSPRIRAISDQDLLPALRQVDPTGTLPLAGELLRALVARLRAAFWIDGDLRVAGGRYSLELRLLRKEDGGVVAAGSFRDLPNVVSLAQESAQWVRQRAGESSQSLAANSGAVGKFTSEVPEALEKYYDAMDRFTVGDMGQVIPLLEEAIRLDPNFAQAHNMLGMTLNPLGRYDDAFREVELAMGLSSGLPERERIAIETNYYLLAEDPVKMIQAARRNVADHPDEPRSYRVLANALSRIGAANEAIQYNRKAVELAPADGLQIVQLQDALSETGRFEESLQEFQAAVSHGVENKWIYAGAGTAYLGLERYTDALLAFREEPLHSENSIDTVSAKVLEGDLDFAISSMLSFRAATDNSVNAHIANEFLCGLYYLSDRQVQARECLQQMTDLPAYPPMIRRLDCTVFWAARLGDDAVLAKAAAIISQIAGRWSNSLTRAIEGHASSVQSWRKNRLDSAESGLVQSIGKAFSVWTLFDLAELYAAAGKYREAEGYWQQLEERRGVILARWFPGVLVLAWLHRAMAARARNDRATAQKYSQKVLDHWSATNPRLRVVQLARTTNA